MNDELNSYLRGSIFITKMNKKTKELLAPLKDTVVPFGPIGYITYKKSYARRLNEDDPESNTEEFFDTVSRVVSATNDQLGCNFSPEEQYELADLLLNLKGSVAGRFLWQLGTKTVDKLGLFSLQNCAFVKVDSPVEPFTWAMDALMLGSGVGFNIQKENVYQIPKVKGKFKVTRQDNASADFIVPDSREGWVELLRRTLEAAFITGKSFTYSTQLIRGSGAPIRGFGGTSSGPEILCDGIDNIVMVLNRKSGKKIEPIDGLDIMNIIGTIVVAGNVRRSAEIAIGDADDLVFLSAKRWDTGKIPNWRSMSNNSVVCNDISKLPNEFWDAYKGGGEPYGLINMDNLKSQGRLGEMQYPDPDVDGVNPCAEQGLANNETCCLAEVYLSNINSYDELIKTITYLYRINKHSLLLPCHQKATEDIVHKNMRMGIGVTGYLQSTQEQKDWLRDAYDYLREYDLVYSSKIGVSSSVKLTTVKPAGTLSLLKGTTHGGHAAESTYMIRRLRIASNSPLVDICRKNGYKVEYQRKFDGTDDFTTVVVEFPVSYPEWTQTTVGYSAIDQLKTVVELQSNWSDNSVSVTVTYKVSEIEDIKKWLDENYNDKIKTVSFLIHNDHGFDQAPQEAITKEEFDRISANVKPILGFSFDQDDITSGISECEGGSCPVR